MLPSIKEKSLFPTFRSMMDRFWDMERFFEDEMFRFQWKPAVNIKETDKNFDLEVAAPGMKKEDFDVRIENGVLFITAKKEEKKEEKEENYTRREFSYRSFERSFTLPENVDQEHIEAKYEDGILRLMLKKLAVKKPEGKKIRIA